jgi:hypothetical protein
MKVFAVRGNYKAYAGLLYKNREIASRFYDRPAAKFMALEWEMFDVIKDVGNDGLTTSRYPVGHFAYLESYDNPTMDDTARQALGDGIASRGEFLPLKFGSQTRWLFNCTNLVAALNMDHSVVRREAAPPYDIRELRGPLFFKPEVLKDEWVFLPAERPYEIFVTDKFVNVVEEHKLSGFNFHELWDGDDPLPTQKLVDPTLSHRRDLN